MKPSTPTLVYRLSILAMITLLGVIQTESNAKQNGDAANNFQTAKSILLRQFTDASIDEDDLYRYALEGMLAGLDLKHSDRNRAYDPEQFQEVRMEMSDNVIGVGLQIGFDAKTSRLVVQEIIPDSPAEKLGVKPQDQILQIDGKSVKRLSLQQIVGQLRGKAGEPVSLTLLRGNSILQLELEREHIAYQNVKSRVTSNGTVVITLPAFNFRTATQLKTSLETPAQNNSKGIVLDLRRNSGGDLKNLLSTAGMMLPDHTPLAIAIYRDNKTETLFSQGRPVFRPIPLVVLIDRETACGAEILAQVLRKKLGAVLIGETTAGKWNIQSLEEFPDHSAIKFTVATLRGSHGEGFDGVGITPDFKIDEKDGQHPSDSVLNRALQLLTNSGLGT